MVNSKEWLRRRYARAVRAISDVRGVGDGRRWGDPPSVTPYSPLNRWPGRRSVAIVGAASGWDAAPFDDYDYEIWSCNNLGSITRDAEDRFRADRWFELHDFSDPVWQYRRPPWFRDWIAELPIPVYQIGRRDNLEQSVEFPLAAAIEIGKDYFGCTFCYQIALAILEGFTRIEFYGVALSGTREATVERATTEWWLGLAEGMGTEVIVHPTGEAVSLGQHPGRYGGAREGQERERAAVETWLYRRHLPSFQTFRQGNRPPRTLREAYTWE